MLVCGEEWCGCESVSAHTDVSIVKSEGIVRFWKGGVRQSGECGFERVVGMERVGAAIPPVVARIFSGDSTSPLTREARTWCGARDSAGLGGLVRIGNNPSGSRPILLGDSTSPLTREASLARGEAVDVPLRRLWGLRGSVGVKQSLR